MKLLYSSRMNPNNLVREDELLIPIKSDKALKWVESLVKRFHETQEARDFLALRSGITQQLLEELLPLCKYAKYHYNSPSVLLKYYLDSRNSYDGDFIDENGNLIERVEVTMAIEGQQLRIQAEALIQLGHTPIYQTPSFSGTSKNRKILKAESSIITNDEIFELQAARIQGAYLKKHRNLHKYPGTTLLICTDIPLMSDSEYQEIIGRLVLEEDTFTSIKCVNRASHHCWSLK